MPASWAGSGSRDPGVHGIITITIAISIANILFLLLINTLLLSYFLFRPLLLQPLNSSFTATTLSPAVWDPFARQVIVLRDPPVVQVFESCSHVATSES